LVYIIYAADLLRGFEAVGLQADPLNDWIGYVEPMFEFLAWTLCSDFLSSQPDHFTSSKLAGLCTPIGILLLICSDLLPALLNSSPEFNQLVSMRPRLAHVQGISQPEWPALWPPC
jgi:hypothetical protein